jgi:hypothetical protein
MQTDETVYRVFDDGRPLDAEDMWALERLAAAGDDGMIFDEWYDAVVPHLFDKGSFVPRLCKLVNRNLVMIKGKRTDRWWVYVAAPSQEARASTEVITELSLQAASLGARH